MRIDRVLVVVLLLVLVGLTGGVLLAQSQEEIDLEKGLVAYWSFDEGEGDIAFDATENHNDGTLKCAGEGCSPPTWVEGKIGTAFEFDGVDDYVVVADSESLDITDEITIAAWIYPTLPNQNGRIVVKEKPYTYGMLVINGGYYCYIVIDGVVYELKSAQPADLFPLNQWSSYIFTRKGNTGTVYYNGNQQAQTTDFPIDSIDITDAMLLIGISGQSHQPFTGLIDEISIYNRALTEEEIKALYLKGEGQ